MVNIEPYIDHVHSLLLDYAIINYQMWNNYNANLCIKKSTINNSGETCGNSWEDHLIGAGGRKEKTAGKWNPELPCLPTVFLNFHIMHGLNINLGEREREMRHTL